MSAAPLDTIVVVLAVLVTVLAIVCVVLWRRVTVLARAHRLAFDGGDVDVVGALARHARQIAEVTDRLASTTEHSHGVRQEMRGTLSRVGVVRYDAFDDIGGALSFSAALLDEHDDGIVITSINGRADGRTYLKSIDGGTSEHPLSDEETAAIAVARERPRGGERRVEVTREWRRK